MNWETEEIPVGKVLWSLCGFGCMCNLPERKRRPEAVMSRCQSIRLVGVQEGTLLKDDDTRNLKEKKTRT